MLVLIDTNIFVRQFHLLRSDIGPLFLHFLQLNKGLLFVPGILRREYLEQALDLVQAANQEIRNRVTKVHAIVLELTEPQLPSDEEVRGAFERVLKELAPIIVQLETTDEIIVAAATRSIDRKPPSIKSDHGLKDCILWESILRLEHRTEVCVVTHDRGFLGNSEALAAEAQARNLKVTFYKELGELLTSLQKETPALNYLSVGAALDVALTPARERLRKQWNLVPGGAVIKREFTAYCTTEVGSVFVNFLEEQVTTDELIGEIESWPLRLVLKGSFTWRTESGQLSDLKIERESLLQSDGTVLHQNATVFVEGARLTFGGPSRQPFKNRRWL